MIGDREDDGALVAQLEAAGHVLAAAAPDPGPELALTVKETRASLDTAVAVLAAPERQLILLAYRDGLSQSEIAARLGWPLGTVKTRTRRALRHLRDQVDP